MPSIEVHSYRSLESNGSLFSIIYAEYQHDIEKRRLHCRQMLFGCVMSVRSLSMDGWEEQSVGSLANVDDVDVSRDCNYSATT